MGATTRCDLVCFILIYCNVFFNVIGLNPEIDMNFEQRVLYHGYSVEFHEVTTQDDYIIRLYRIPHGLEGDRDSKNKSVIFIVHGMGGSAINFITLGRDYAPAYYFANNSFDVWMICSRGVDCQNPRKHKKYDWNRDPEYWNFSWHEIGLYDIPTCVDYITKVTGQEKIFYIGHSVGGPEYFVMTTEKPDYNKKFKISTHYGQATFLAYIDYPLLKTVSAILRLLKNTFFSWGVYEAVSLDLQTIIISTARRACSHPLFKEACYNTVPGLLGNKRTNLIERDLSEVVFSTFPRFSLRQLLHYADNIFYKGDFRKFDWGPTKNMEIYGQEIPPLYNMSKSTAMTAFFYGTTDSLSAPEDNWLTMEKLQNTIYDMEIGPKFNHLDFIFSKNATQMLYEPTVKLFKEYDEGKIPPIISRKRSDKQL